MSVSIARATDFRAGGGGFPLPDRSTIDAILAWHEAQTTGVTLIRWPVRGPAGRPGPVGDLIVVDDWLYRDAAQKGPDTSLAECRSIWPDRIRAVTFDSTRGLEVVLLDRDGTLVVDYPYLSDPAGIELLPQTVEALRLFEQSAIRRVVVTNQSGIARGRITMTQLESVHHRLREVLALSRVSIDGIYACPHGSDEGCGCRKPAAGLAFQAQADLGLNLGRSVVIGDKAADIGLARQLGVPAILVRTGEGTAVAATGEILPDFVVDDVGIAARICTNPLGLPFETTLP